LSPAESVGTDRGGGEDGIEAGGSGSITNDDIEGGKRSVVVILDTNKTIVGFVGDKVGTGIGVNGQTGGSAQGIRGSPSCCACEAVLPNHDVGINWINGWNSIAERI